MIKGDWGGAVLLAVPAFFCTWAALTSVGMRNQMTAGLLALAFWIWFLYYLLTDKDIFS